VFDYLASITADADRMADVIADGPLDAVVPSCPGWDLRDLAHHMGEIHRWARLAATTAAPPADDAIELPPASGDDECGRLAAWLRAGAASLVGALADIPSEAPTWHPFPVPRVAAVWPRRQAHETAIHRWDAENAVDRRTPLDPALASDFVREYFEVIVPRVVDRDDRVAPVGILEVRLTDTRTDLVVMSNGREVVLTNGIATCDATIEGAAQDIVLALWRRQPLAGAPADGLGAQWLDFGGN
jgi:uncharacterized protein (TIGR03083 family)